MTGIERYFPWLVLPVLIQASAMMADEFLFHRRRGLPRWERIGHPLDTLTILACYAWILAFKPDRDTIVGLIVLGVFSSVFVTKDEGIHHRYCGAGEHWLHAVLFILHPIVLAILALIWVFGQASPLARAWIIGSGMITLLFFTYQTIYWNLIYPRRNSDAKRP